MPPDLLAYFSSAITLGSVVVAAIVGLAGLATIAYGIKWKTVYQTEHATAETLREGREAYRLQAERFQAELADCKAQRSTLEATHSLQPILEAVLAGFAEMEHRFTQHEQRAQERHETNQKQGEQHLHILELIAERLGPDMRGHASSVAGLP